MRYALWFALIYALLAAAAVVLAVEAVWPMAIPPALCALPLLAAGRESAMVVRRVSLVCAALLAAVVVLGSMTVGGLFVPSVVALVVAADAARRGPTQASRPAV